jgi:hypothetical protein
MTRSNFQVLVMRVKQLFNTDLLHVQQYLFTKLKIEPTRKVEVEYDVDGLKLLQAVKVDDGNHPTYTTLLQLQDLIAAAISKFLSRFLFPKNKKG